MRWLRDYRRHGDPLVLIRVFAALELAVIAWTEFVPGAPYYSDTGGSSLGTALIVTLLVIYFLARGSLVAWWIAIFFATAGAGVGIAATVFAFEPKTLGFAILESAALVVVWSRSVEHYVLDGRADRGSRAPLGAR